MPELWRAPQAGRSREGGVWGAQGGGDQTRDRGQEKGQRRVCARARPSWPWTPASVSKGQERSREPWRGRWMWELGDSHLAAEPWGARGSLQEVGDIMVKVTERQGILTVTFGPQWRRTAVKGRNPARESLRDKERSRMGVRNQSGCVRRTRGRLPALYEEGRKGTDDGERPPAESGPGRAAGALCDSERASPPRRDQARPGRLPSRRPPRLSESSL